MAREDSSEEEPFEDTLMGRDPSEEVEIEEETAPDSPAEG